MEQLLGQTLGRYRLDALLGRGNRASVYRATDLIEQQTVALRVLDRELSADPAFMARFRHAATTAAALRHPHILPILNYGEQDGYAFLARPYITGGSLREWLGKPLPLDTVLRLLGPIATALDYAHQQGVVHGDVKPGNILLHTADHPLLADLGAAQVLPQGNSLVSTARGLNFGTPEYLAPEQVLGLTLDGHADLYALGVMLYEALTGRPPFRAESPSDTARALIMRHLAAAPPAPRALNPALSPAVEAVLLRALAKEPNERFPTGAALIAALDEARHAVVPVATSVAGLRAEGAALGAWPAVPSPQDSGFGTEGSGDDWARFPVLERAPGTEVALAAAAPIQDSPPDARGRERRWDRAVLAWTPPRWLWWALVVYAVLLTAVVASNWPALVTRAALGGGTRIPATATARVAAPVVGSAPPTATAPPTAIPTLAPTATVPAPTATLVSQASPPVVASPAPPTATPTPAPTATATTPSFVATDQVIGTVPVNFRAGPGTDYRVEGVLDPGTALSATGESAQQAGLLWRQFRLADGRVGWVRDIDVAPVNP